MISLPFTDRGSGEQRAPVWRVASVMAVLLVLAGLIAWSMWRRGKWFGLEDGSALEYQPAKAAVASHPAPLPPSKPSPTVPPPGSMPDPTAANTPNLPSTPLKKPSPRIRMPLARPVPESETPSDVPIPRHKRHHRDFLGIGKLWHWIRHDHKKSQE